MLRKVGGLRGVGEGLLVEEEDEEEGAQDLVHALQSSSCQWRTGIFLADTGVADN